jgi:hypothetical protein
MTELFTKPINPDEAEKLKREMMPGYVIEAFNQCIAAGYDGRSSTVYQKDVIKKILFLANEVGDTELTRAQIFDRSYLDVEPLFEAEGWKVTYDKPGYNEDYEAHFIFSKKRK